MSNPIEVIGRFYSAEASIVTLFRTSRDEVLTGGMCLHLVK